MSYSFLCPLRCLPQCLLNSKCSANVGEVCFIVLQVARLPVELIYGCSACGYTNAGVAAVLIRTQLEDPTFLLLTLERVKRDSLETGGDSSTSEVGTKDRIFLIIKPEGCYGCKFSP